MVAEQDKDEILSEIKIGLKTDKLSHNLASRYVIHDNILYFISNVDSEPILRLCIPSHLKMHVIQQYHDLNGHVGTDLTYNTIKQKYYWPNMYKELLNYVSSCITCQTRNLTKIKAPLQETDIPPYAFAKIALDVSGPYPTSLSGNKYIVSFIDLYSGYPEAFAVPDKSADTIVHLLIDEIFPRYGTVLELLMDNGTENVNRKMKETLNYLRIKMTLTTFFRPQSNGKIERYHRVLVDIMSKKLKDNLNTWDIHLNQTLAAIRFSVSDASKFSPFFLLFNRDVVLPLDNILKPRRKYTGEDLHQIALEQQHKAFLQVHQNLKASRRRHMKHANKNTSLVKFEIGDAVYYKTF
jgi:transposase InsO family protein